MKKMKKIIMSLAVSFLLAGSFAVGGMAAEQTQQAQQEFVEFVTVGEEGKRIVIGFRGVENSSGAVLTYCDLSSGAVFTQRCTEVIDNQASFEISFQNEDQNTQYQLKTITIESEGESYEQSLEGIGPECIAFEGNVSAPEVSGIVFEEGKQPAYARPGEDPVIIVLDPGHDKTHAGAYQNRLREEELNLKIALYCKEELEQYYGVTVYMTRDEDGSCPHAGQTAAKCNEKRVAYAKSVDADIFISLHNNSSSSTSPKGAIVYYPNTNYNREISNIGKGVARKIQDRLVAQGLYNNGISMKYSADYTYPDGSTADYYAVIRNSKLLGMPAIIVEHAFMTNQGDVSGFLSSDAKLKALGVADAKAIAEYFELSKEVPKPSLTPEATMAPIETSTPVQTPEEERTPAEGQPFADVYDEWYLEYVKFVYEHGLMTGIGGTMQFEPNGTVTKAQVAQVLFNMEGSPEVTDKKACTELKDVYEDWYTDAVCWAYNTGVVTGDLVSMEFSPNAQVKREELALMIYRYAIYKQYEVGQTSDFSGLLNADQVSEWAKAGMQWAVGANLISGIEGKDASGKVVYDLKPQGTATRAQMAAILMRFCQAYD